MLGIVEVFPNQDNATLGRRGLWVVEVTICAYLVGLSNSPAAINCGVLPCQSSGLRPLVAIWRILAIVHSHK